jgi:hypothetical protein
MARKQRRLLNAWLRDRRPVPVRDVVAAWEAPTDGSASI